MLDVASMALLRAAMQTMKKHFTLLTSAACFFAFLTFAPDAPTEDSDAADPQGRGSKNRGDQEQ
jgi:hypothetical protein